MPWLLDTNVWINLPKDPNSRIADRLLAVPPSEVFLCSVVKAELWHGANKYANRERRLDLVDQLFHHHASLAFDDEAALHYADIRHDLEVNGEIIGPNDLMIASICRANALTLVTCNSTEFSRVPQLHIEDWLAEVK